MINGISGMSPWSAYGVYGASYANRASQAQGAEKAQSVQRPSAVWTARKAAQPDAPVQPVTAVRPVDGSEQKPGRFALSLREGADPVEMAVRMRIKYMGDDPAGQKSALGADQLKDPALENAKSPQEVMEEGQCQTCKERKYQDGSDDPGVSFKTPTSVAPEQAAGAVRGHENEHVVREQAKARREDRKVVSQSVTYHTGICPECGTAYVSGGTTRTVTKANTDGQAQQQSSQQQDPRKPFSVVA
ncbi:MAG: hypothetical protein HFF20_06485 [Oscillospiraceae bacterium]|jgi:hypothetical protein|nr:hypothetical protein [Oscillospiraceae bacterium]MCI9548855.1 hypothetical protein [Oscillospiraceae bacterium]